jgi:hypothetical protein
MPALILNPADKHRQLIGQLSQPAFSIRKDDCVIER